MAAPATTARATPGGTHLDDGFPTKIAFEDDADISFREKSVTPPGLDGGDAIDTTTMFNTAYTTKAAQALMDGTDVSATVAYDPAVYDQIIALINVDGGVTIHFPNGDTVDFFGYLKSFTPSSAVRGSQPEAEVTIVQTNWDSVAGVEQGPVFTAAV